MSGFKVILTEPEIPSNTGNIGRTCVATNSSLILIGPLGFEISSPQLKRAGLDYWPLLDWKYYTCWSEWRKTLGAGGYDRLRFFSVKGRQNLYDVKFQPGDSLVFGKETAGLGEKILQLRPEQTVRIPVSGPVRSLNLANAAAIALYEALRQTGALSSDKTKEGAAPL